VEVLTYIVEGAASYEFGPGPADPLTSGSVKLLTATSDVAHSINPGKGGTVRSFAVVALLPPGATGSPRLQSGNAISAGIQPDGTVVRSLVGPGTALTSMAGLAGETIEFRSAGTAFRKVGHDRVAVCYAISGRGMVDSDVLDGGEAALVENAAGVALQGQPGFHVVLVSGPRGL
jgi:redox-sensitive bicupin YhaK (pirin superfamily)